jgi:hypothetical protein
MNTTMVSESKTTVPNKWVSGLVGGAIALIGSLALWVIARLLGISLLVASGPPGQSPPAPLSAGQIIIVVAISALAATAVFALLRRIFDQRANRIFQVIAVVVLLLSFGGPLSLPVSAANKIVLGLMHLVTGASIVWALTLRK